MVRAVVVLVAGLLALVAGCGDGGAADHDAGTCPEFWGKLAIHAEWAAYFPTIEDLAQASEVMLYGPIKGFETGPTIQGDAPEDRYTELRMTFDDAAEIWRGDVRPSELKLTITPGQPDTTLEKLSACVPDSPVLLLARKRVDQDAYIPLNGYGLWATTPRAAIDTPFGVDPLDRTLYKDELDKHDSLESFARALRAYADAGDSP